MSDSMDDSDCSIDIDKIVTESLRSIDDNSSDEFSGEETCPASNVSQKLDKRDTSFNIVKENDIVRSDDISGSDASNSSDDSDGSEGHGNNRSLGFLIDKLPGNSTTEKEKQSSVFREKKKKKGKLKNEESALSSSLQTPNLDTDFYIATGKLGKETDVKKFSSSSSAIKNKVDDILKKSVLQSDFEKKHCLPPYEVSVHKERKERKLERSKTKGANWFNMPAAEMTEERKNDLAVLKMRHILDPKRFYKRTDISAKPKFFQMGKVIEGAGDFYNRVPKKQRKKNIVDELLEDAEIKRYTKRKYAEIVEKTERKRGSFRHMKRQKKRKR